MATEGAREDDTEVLPWAHGEGLNATLELPVLSPDAADARQDRPQPDAASDQVDEIDQPDSHDVTDAADQTDQVDQTDAADQSDETDQHEAPVAAPSSAASPPPQPASPPPAREPVAVNPPPPAIPLVAQLSRPDAPVSKAVPPPPGSPTGPAATTHPAPRPSGKGWTRPRIALLGVLAIAAAAAGGAALAELPRDAAGGGGQTQSAQAADQVIKPVAVTSLDPSGGSGLRRSGDQWQTQTYVDAAFGNLKDGVGLVLDLGSERSVTSVSVDVASAPLVLELRAADQQPTSAASFQRVGEPRTAESTGSTTLAANGESHRYWLVWISRLAPQNGGYAAVISTPTVRGAQ